MQGSQCAVVVLGRASSKLRDCPAHIGPSLVSSSEVQALTRFLPRRRSTQQAPWQETMKRDYDALVFEGPKRGGDEELAQNYVAKKKKKNKGTEVVFDPKKHK